MRKVGLIILLFSIIILWNAYAYFKEIKNNDNNIIYFNIEKNISSNSATVSNSLILDLKHFCDSIYSFRNYNKIFNGALVIAYKDSIIFQRCEGYRDYKTKIPVDNQSFFELASASKPITATAILLAYEKKYLSIYDSVSKFIPDFPYPDVTIFHLLTHRSGLPEYFYFCDHYISDKKKYISNSDVIQTMIKNKIYPYYKPNKRFKYCNTNYVLLASIIEISSGKNFKDFVRREIFEKIGENEIYFFDELQCDSIKIKKTTGYYRNGKEYVPLYLNGVYGDKGIYLTPIGLYKFLRALDKGELISDSLKYLAWNENYNEIKNKHTYALGWRIYFDNNRKIVYHTGKWNGFKSLAVILPEIEIYAVFLSNNYRSYGFLVEDFSILADFINQYKILNRVLYNEDYNLNGNNFKSF